MTNNLTRLVLQN